MAAAFAFLGIFLTSLLVAVLAALSLGEFFRANDELVPALAGIAGFAAFTTAVFAACYRTARHARALNRVAMLLALFAAVLAAMPGLVGWIASFSTNPFTVGQEEQAIVVELLVPALLAVLLQWGLVRRRYLQMTGEVELSRWPWIATALAAILLLNPVGMAFVAASFRPDEMMWILMASVTAVLVGALVVMAGIECYIRGRILRRRQTSVRPVAGLQAAAHGT